MIDFSLPVSPMYFAWEIFLILPSYQLYVKIINARRHGDEKAI